MKFSKYVELTGKKKLGEMPLRKYTSVDSKAGVKSYSDKDGSISGDEKSSLKMKDKKGSKGTSIMKPVDRRIANSPGFVKKLHKKLGNSELPFNIIVVNTKQGKDYTEYGRVEPEWVEENLGLEGYEPEEDDINIIFTNNSGTARENISPWILMHRFSHAIVASGRRGKDTSDSYQHTEFRKEFIRNISELAEELYGMRITQTRDGWVKEEEKKQWNALMNSILTMKSARENKINRPNEVFHELVAQKVVTEGGIKFNPFPEVLKVAKGFQYNLKDKERAEEAIQMLETDIDYLVDSMLGTTYGSTYVM